MIPNTLHYTLGDCVEGMKQFPDKFFDLAIVDPPYGDGKQNIDGSISGGVQPIRRQRQHIREVQVNDLAVSRTGGTWAEKYGKKIIAWDAAPEKEYFDELFRVSRNQIIWGGNYFELPPTRCFIVWRKTNIPSEGFSMAPIEYAWTSFFRNAVIYDAFSSRKANEPERIHACQKPVALYQWILQNFAKTGYKILDTMVGSGSSLIACARMGFEAWGWEIDPDYYQASVARIKRELAQGTLF